MAYHGCFHELSAMQSALRDCLFEPKVVSNFWDLSGFTFFSHAPCVWNLSIKHGPAENASALCRVVAKKTNEKRSLENWWNNLFCTWSKNPRLKPLLRTDAPHMIQLWHFASGIGKPGLRQSARAGHQSVPLCSLHFDTFCPLARKTNAADEAMINTFPI